MNNPYSPPEAEFTTLQADTADTKIFAVHGRIGRLRYLAYSFGLNILVFAVALALGAVLAFVPIMAGILIVLAYVLSFAITIVVSRRRLNDMDRSGWWGLLMLVPLVNVIFGLWLVFGRGDDGANSFGLPPPPNTRGVIALAVVLPVVFIVGMLAASAIPAYKQYTDRARASQSF